MQEERLRELLYSWEFTELHHGDAIGVDELAHKMAAARRNALARAGTRLTIISHPPVNDSKRAFCEDADEVCVPKDYLERDRDIAAESDVLIALPSTADEQRRSGTWATVRYARKLGRVLIIRINPDGSVTFG
jgi:predicted Rossmann fold nucleotide-binding protein DprA/Smf involved in DNA uptake